jgi:hypothetical protein
MKQKRIFAGKKNHRIMESKARKQMCKQAHIQETATKQRPKSKTTLFWEKYPEGIGLEIVNMRAVLK